MFKFFQTLAKNARRIAKSKFSSVFGQRIDVQPSA